MVMLRSGCRHGEENWRFCMPPAPAPTAQRRGGPWVRTFARATACGGLVVVTTGWL